MDMLKKALAAILGLTALAVLAHFVLEPFYEDSIDTVRVWGILNVFMAFGAVVALAATFIDKRRIGSGENSTTKEYIAVNTAFYAAALLAIWFFWNWVYATPLFAPLTSDDIGSDLFNIHLLYWGFIDPLYIIITTVVSIHLWYDEPSKQE